MIIPKQDLIDDIGNINKELERWNKNPWLPTKYIKTLVESHLKMYEKLESITVLCAEGVEFMTRTGLAEAILKTIEED